MASPVCEYMYENMNQCCKSEEQNAMGAKVYSKCIFTFITLSKRVRGDLISLYDICRTL